MSIARVRGLTTDAVAGILAALSPSISWENNIHGAIELITTGKIKRYGGYRANLRKAERILGGESPDSVLGGQKVTSFYRLIRDGGNNVDVVVDAHAASVADGKHYLWKQTPRLDRRGRYEKMTRVYQRAAKTLGVNPHEVQAATWLAWKRIKHESMSTDLSTL